MPPTHPRRLAVLKRNRWAFLTRAGTGIAGGLAILAVAATAPGPVLWVVAGWLALDGALAMATGLAGARRAEQWGGLVTRGLAALAMAAVLALWSDMPRPLLIWLLMIWAIVTGLLELSVARLLPRSRGRPAAGTVVALSFLLGVLLALGPPAAAAWLVGLYAMAQGAALGVWATRLRA